MKKIYIVANNILDYNTEKITIGGVQTYVWNLAELLDKNGYIPTIIQCSTRNFLQNINGVQIIGIKSKNRKIRTIKNSIKNYLNKSLIDEIVIFSTDIYNFKNKFKKTISIQHGIYWDMDKKPFLGLQILEDIINFTRSFYIRNRIRKSKVTVCVDYNFINWYRTQQAKNENIFRVIPNFSLKNMHAKIKSDDKIKIIFARRFEKYRGTRIFADAISRILEEFEKVEVILAGDGSDLGYLKEKLQKQKKVKFIKYQHYESLLIHSDVDIAVIPTTGSEGTSLSALEAMASNCALICSNVGGLTNIIINNFNGLIINPTVEDLYRALKKLIINSDLRKILAKNALKTVSQGFSKEKWESEWLEVIEELEVYDK